MEDFYDIKSSRIDDKPVNFFGVFDGEAFTFQTLYLLNLIHLTPFVITGHGGTHAAGYLKQHLFENLLKHPAFIGDTKSAMSMLFSPRPCCSFSCELIDLTNGKFAGESYKKTDTDFLDAECNIQVGSTASTAVLIGNHLYVANVGDSRAVMSKAGKGFAFLKFYCFTIQLIFYNKLAYP